MKRFLWFLLLMCTATLAARAQTATITGPSSPVAVATGAVTVTGTQSGATSVAITITNNALGTTAASGNATISGSNWSFAFTPTNVGDYLIRAVPAIGGTNGTAALATLTISSIAPTVSLAITGGSSSIPVGGVRFLAATATDDGAITKVEFYMDSVLLGTVTSPSTGSVYTFPFTAPTLTGSHQLNARAYDNAGNSTSSSFVTIEVDTPVGSPPTVGLNTPIGGAFLPVGTATTITGSVADSDGAVTSVQVFVNGVTGAAAGLSPTTGLASISNGTWTINWTPTAIGTVSLSAIATDDRNNSVAAPAVAVNVTDSSSPAITLGLSPNTATVPASTTLPAGATRNIVVNATPTNGRAVVRVEFFVNGTKVGEKTTAPYTYRFVAPAATGPYVFSARATDNTGLARDAQITFTVTSAVGSPPTVNLLTPTSGSVVVPNTSVSLAASALATGGTISSVQFYVNGSPASVNAGNGITTAPYISSFTPTAPGSYVIDAIATDDRSNTTISNSVTITAAFGTPSVTITSPNANATARATPNIPLTISATATGGSGAAVLLVEFLLDGVQIGTKTTPTVAGGSLYSFAWTPTAAQLGLHQLTARVTDTNSLTATSTPPVNVNVANIVGTPPTVTITTQPAQTATNFLQSLSTVNFIANAFASGSSTLSSVEFFLNDASIGLAAREQTTNLWRLAYNLANYDFSSITPDVNGRYPVTLYAIAKDSNNNQTISTTTNLAIAPSTSAAPTVQLVSAIGSTSVTQNTSFFMLATPSDSDGTVTSLQLYVNGSPSGGAIANPGAQTLVTYTPAAAGRFNLYVVATDDTGNTAVSTPAIVLNVTAITAPTTALTRPTDDSTVTTVNAPVFLQATAAGSDPTQIPTVAFLATASGGGRTTINATRIGTTTTYRAVWTPTTADTYTVVSQATISGVSGNSAVSRRVVVNNVIGIAPTITITVPTTVTSASTSNFVATATSSSGSITGVEFFVNRTSVGLATRDQLTNTWRLNASYAGLPTGANEVVALAYDSSGNTAASPTGSINITAGTGVAPTVTVFAAPASIALGQSVVLTAAASSITGTVTNVTYFANATNLASRTTPPSPGQAGYQFTWTNATVGTYNVYAVATDSNNNTNVSAPIIVTVRRFAPLLDDDAFVLQTYVDISNNSAPNLILESNYAAQLTAGTLTRAQLVATLTNDNGNGFNAPVNILTAYYLLMGQWPTPVNYSTLITGFRNNLAGAVGNILASPEYVAKYPWHITPTVTLLQNPASVIPATTFEQVLWANAGLGAPTPQEDLAFRNNATATATLGRGYNVAGLNTAIAEFITNTNSTNLALRNLGEAAALFYQLDKPPTTMSTDDIATHIAAIAALPDTASQADLALKDILYTYRYVTILSSPQPLVVAAHSGAIFRVSALGAPPITYQWLFNGVPISGATNSFLSLTNVDSTKAGTYTVLVSTPNGSATSDPATLTLSNALTKLGNISTRGTVGVGGQTLIAGFVVTGPPNQTRQMLIRVIGPGLATQGVTTGLLADPRLEVYGPSSNTTPILTNDNWGTQTANAQTNATAVTAIQQAAVRTGAFPLPNTASADAVVLATLAPGNYTVEAKGQNNAASGIVLVEVYDASTTSTATTPKPINVSTRGFVGSGANSLIAGFVINGTVSRRMLIRGVGPTLSAFKLAPATLLADPQIELFDSTSTSLGKNDDWASGDDAATIAAAAVSGGAFPLANGSKDAAMLVMLAPGAYTVQVTGTNNTTGIGLVEVYDVDP